MSNRQSKKLAQLQRRKQVAELYLQGLSQPEIAAELQISQPTVCTDLRAIRKEWRNSSIRNFDEAREMELRKIDLLESEAWAAWKRSQKPMQSAVVSGAGGNQTARKTMKHQVGDPRFLQQVHQCIAQRRAVLGLDVMPGLNPENPADAHVTLQVRLQRIDSYLAAIGHRQRIGGPGAGPDPGQPGDVRSGDQ